VTQKPWMSMMVSGVSASVLMRRPSKLVDLCAWTGLHPRYSTVGSYRQERVVNEFRPSRLRGDLREGDRRNS
jgi:hypothetical protein